jgi:hypothetical protein
MLHKFKFLPVRPHYRVRRACRNGLREAAGGVQGGMHNTMLSRSSFPRWCGAETYVSSKTYIDSCKLVIGKDIGGLTVKLVTTSTKLQRR